MAITKQAREQLIDAIFEGSMASYDEFFRDSSDGGTCNFDAVLIRIDRTRFATLKGIVDECNRKHGMEIRLEEHERGWGMLGNIYKGQAGLRTRMMKSALKMIEKLAPEGVQVSAYYQMD